MRVYQHDRARTEIAGELVRCGTLMSSPSNDAVSVPAAESSAGTSFAEGVALVQSP